MAASQLQHARSKLWSGGSSLQCVGLLWLRAAGAALVAGVHVVPDLVAGSFVSLACVSL